MRKFVIILSLGLSLTGCTPPQTPPGPPSVLPEDGVWPDSCGPAYEAMTGRNIGEFTLPPALAYRVLQPGAVMTQDLNPARLNIFVDEKGWIERISCG